MSRSRRRCSDPAGRPCRPPMPCQVAAVGRSTGSCQVVLVAPGEVGVAVRYAYWPAEVPSGWRTDASRPPEGSRAPQPAQVVGRRPREVEVQGGGRHVDAGEVQQPVGGRSPGTCAVMVSLPCSDVAVTEPMSSVARTWKVYTPGVTVAGRVNDQSYDGAARLSGETGASQHGRRAPRPVGRESLQGGGVLQAHLDRGGLRSRRWRCRRRSGPTRGDAHQLREESAAASRATGS